ncbi:hypothetical protein KU06062604_970005 [Flavobacterium psychrophilum]|nr:hypothetical protein KU06062604_970005 [Flavobacterium psychrophilum]
MGQLLVIKQYLTFVKRNVLIKFRVYVVEKIKKIELNPNSKLII